MKCVRAMESVGGTNLDRVSPQGGLKLDPREVWNLFLGCELKDVLCKNGEIHVCDPCTPYSAG